MEQIKHIDELRRTFLGRILGRRTLSFKTIDNVLCLYKLDAIQHILGSDASFIFEYGIFSSSLKISIDKNIYTYGFIEKSDAIRCEQNLKDFIINYLSNIIKKEIKTIQTSLRYEYLRDSKASKLMNNVQLLKKNIAELNNKDASVFDQISEDYFLESESIPEEVKKFLSIILDYCKNNYLPNDSYVIEQIKKEYEESILQKHKDFFDHAEKNPLTKKQRLAVIRNNDFNLVLAAAGTGKTSVMVAKALYLMKYHDVKSDELLILAYNKNAANELQNRIKERAEILGLNQEPPQILTFHALGRKILLDCKQSVHISKLSEDEKKLWQWVSNWEENSIYAHPLDYLSFYTAIHAREKNGIEIVDNNSPLRTLKDELVKSNSEVRIADWLYLHGIPYTYEAPYVTKRRIENNFDYSPDFKLTDDIYIEFFGIDRNGNTREDIDKEKYNDEMNKKIQLHKEVGTTLIDLYWYEMQENTLFDKLEKKLVELGFQIKNKSEEEIKKLFVERMNNNQFSTQHKILLNSLKAIRVENLNKEQILQRLKAAGFSFAKNLTEYIQKLVDDYVNTLRENNEIDFDDMILTAKELIDNGKWLPPYKYILVDEFQDISEARYELIKAIYSHCNDISCTMVGDDWQAIYRFSGGKLELTTRFSEYFGPHTQTILDKTFRYPRNIADVAGDFIMKNPEQYKKKIETADNTKDSKIHLFSYMTGTEETCGEKSLFSNVRRYILTLDQNKPNSSVAIMARYNLFLDEFKRYFYEKNRNECIQPKIKINYWTFHGSKGLEADYTFIIGLQRNGVRDFPAENQDDKVVEALLPTADTYPYSEERRLFYVALTRARKHTYLFANDKQPSPFVEELLSPKYNIDIRTAWFKNENRSIFKCPCCKNGYFQLVQGKYREFYICNSGMCRIRPRICKKCGSPMLDERTESKCMNPQCQNTIQICERCGREMVLRKNNKNGSKFWGCSGYGLDKDNCNNTRQLIRMWTQHL
ncbi:MAG: UvrD-helicase domain-containing protein [Succinivibrio dextrinosolvens]|nr:UvrD-helicase domain-containing protein [Succinivibrio dextrinosolvens]